MLVSYDQPEADLHSSRPRLQGHQNVGELRLVCLNEFKCYVNCRVTRMLVSYDWTLHNHWGSVEYCRVTRMLVSYDRPSIFFASSGRIAGSPECWWVTTSAAAVEMTARDCRVTRMLVSYDLLFCFYGVCVLIAGSPECWWVTTYKIRIYFPWHY